MSTVQSPLLGSQLDWTHPLSPGTEIYLPLNEGSGRIVNDLVGNKQYPIAVLSGAAVVPYSWLPTTYGTALSFGEASHYHINTRHQDTVLGVRDYAITILWRCPTPSTTAFLYEKGGVATIALTLSSTPTVNLTVLSAVLVALSAVQISIGGWNVTTITRYMGLHYAYNNKRLCDTGVHGGDINDILSPWVFGGAYTLTTHGIQQGSIKLVIMHVGRGLSYDEVGTLHRDPYCMIKQVPYSIYRPGGSASFSPDSLGLVSGLQSSGCLLDLSLPLNKLELLSALYNVTAGSSLNVSPDALALLAATQSTSQLYDYSVLLSSAFSLAAALQATTVKAEVNITVLPGTQNLALTLPATVVTIPALVAIASALGMTLTLYDSITASTTGRVLIVCSSTSPAQLDVCIGGVLIARFTED